MTGWLIYSEEGIKRNGTFIRFWMDSARKRGVEMQLRLDTDPILPPYPDFAVVRVMDPFLSETLESLGIPTFNSARVSRICNDKWNTYCLAKELGIPFPAAEPVDSPADYIPKQYPFVLKSRTGHGGTQVYLIHSPQELQTAVTALNGIPSLAQKPVRDLGRDVRVYVLGDRILASMLRISDTDFRSNFCLGGRAVPYTLTFRETEMVRAFTDALSPGLIGVDFLFDGGEAVFNEIEDVVGCRMLYSMTDLDPVQSYLDWILQQLSAM